MLRPLPFRGDLIAAGAVVLAVGVVLLDLRMAGDWPAGVRLTIAAAAAALLLALGLRSPVEGEAPRAYVSALLLAAFPLVVLALVDLVDAVGADLSDRATRTAIGLGLAVLYGGVAAARNSATSTLLAGTAAVFAATSLVDLRWAVLACLAVLVVCVVRLHERRHSHAIALANAAGIAALYLAYGLLTEAVQPGIVVVDESDRIPAASEPAIGTCWELVLLAVGFGLVAFGAVERERGPAWLGAAVLASFVGLGVAFGSGVLWWPALLVSLGLGVVAAGLRPTTPAPPPPDADAPPAPTTPFEPRESRP